jgi:flagellar secretion chaperone FliS
VYGNARARYMDVDVTSRVEGASPHRLIGILFEELDKIVDAMVVAQGRGDVSRVFNAQSRALTILHGLETSLDFKNGGEIAPGLAAIYREARRLLRAAPQESSPQRIESARDLLREVSGAWAAIA